MLADLKLNSWFFVLWVMGKGVPSAGLDLFEPGLKLAADNVNLRGPLAGSLKVNIFEAFSKLLLGVVSV